MTISKKQKFGIATVALIGLVYFTSPETKEECLKKAASIAKTDAAFTALQDDCYYKLYEQHWVISTIRFVTSIFN